MKQQIKNIVRSALGRTSQPAPVLPEQDMFITWLRFANAGMLLDGNVVGIEHAIKNLPSTDSVIEIGSFCGLSTNVISFFLRKYKKEARLITADKWIFEGAEQPSSRLGSSNLPHSEYKTFVKESYIRNVKFFSKDHLPYTVEVFSDEFFHMWSQQSQQTDVLGRLVALGGPISFAYIDGNHTYDFAKRDFINADKHLVVGGFILFDDSGDGSGWEVTRVIDEIKQEGRYEVIMNNPNYLVKKLR